MKNQIVVSGDAIAKNDNSPVDYLTIPEMIYDQMSKRLGIGDEKKIEFDYDCYRMRELNHLHAMTGFNGAIGLRSKKDFCLFVLWPYVPKGDGSVFEPSPILKVIAHLSDTGIWAYGRGELTTSQISVEMPQPMKAFHPSMKLISLTIMLVHQLCLNPNIQWDVFWENDRYSGDFTKP